MLALSSLALYNANIVPALKKRGKPGDRGITIIGFGDKNGKYAKMTLPVDLDRAEQIMKTPDNGLSQKWELVVAE